jgi:hypothetical protein
MIGTNRQNVTTNVEKWQLDSDGVRRMYQGRNREQKEVEHDSHLHPSIEVLHENGVHAQPIVTAAWDEFMAERLISPTFRDDH